MNVARISYIFSFAFVALHTASMKIKDSSYDLSRKNIESNPFEQIAKYIVMSAGKDSETLKIDEVKSVLPKLSFAQSTLKSMDGATHQLLNTFKDM